jgi:hypothetical protein
MTVPHRSPTVPRERSTHRSPVPHPLGERERGALDGVGHRSPPSKAVEAKVERLLIDRRVHIVRVQAGEIDAVVEGDTGTYVVGRRDGRFVCSCPALGPCSHALAVDAVVDPAPEAPR